MSNISIEEKKHLKSVFDKIIPKNKASAERGPKFYHFLDGLKDNVYSAYGLMM